ncbi:hypothetical protein OMY_01387 [Enterococcus sulfureus ATCC 49903]|uniref:Uncharacterized protein n=1 Tax=Enterococcus sulfureus ATCC 49903 TaxID=1140003 RepID=S0P5A0_9ENTE|nr:hypothetical protein [Enterococcus sulfureus]EOT47134.1 hypothetical protein OMY_01387 [Enterococcus sulfureus ATCC 49903]EOT83571.1 hypothetical protein I573_01293 [Enterococcus sulfureus ATCC 49903]
MAYQYNLEDAKQAARDYFSDKLDVYVSNLLSMSKSQLKKTILETEERAVRNESDELSYVNLVIAQYVYRERFNREVYLTKTSLKGVTERFQGLP